jgi:VanZ like family.
LNGKLNLIPFIELQRILVKGDLWQFIYLFIGNIIWFIPFGFMMRILTKLNKLKIAICALILSFLIELMQFIFGTGISELDDLILNTLGALIGMMIYHWIALLIAQRKQNHLSQ